MPGCTIHYILLPAYPVLPSPTPSYLIQPHPTLYPTAILTSSYTGVFCNSAVFSYIPVTRLSKFRISIDSSSNLFRPQSRAWSALGYAKLASFDGRSLTLAHPEIIVNRVLWCTDRPSYMYDHTTQPPRSYTDTVTTMYLFPRSGSQIVTQAQYINTMMKNPDTRASIVSKWAGANFFLDVLSTCSAHAQ